MYYLPVYLQASKDKSALHSGIDMLGMSFTIPAFAIFTGISVEIFNKYRPQNYVGWMFTIVGFGLFTMLGPKSPAKMYIGFQIPLGVGLGILWISSQFPILAPLPFSNSAHALSFFTFIRCFAQVRSYRFLSWELRVSCIFFFLLTSFCNQILFALVRTQSWGIVVGGTILQNELLKNLPADFTAQFPQGVQIAYAVIPTIKDLDEPRKEAVRAVFAHAVRLIWRVMIGISGAGLLSCLLMKEEQLRTDMDEQWGLQAREQNKADEVELGKEVESDGNSR